MTDHRHTIQGIHAPLLDYPDSTPVTKSNLRFPLWPGISAPSYRQMVGAKRLKSTGSHIVMILVTEWFSSISPSLSALKPDPTIEGHVLLTLEYQLSSIPSLLDIRSA